MILDPELLSKAEAAALRLAEAEREVLQSRADYHTLIRRLHLAGGSFRVIAQRLGMSHQRVQQIVDSAGGTWWQRIWRTRTIKRDAVCTFCGRPPSEVSKLIAGPNVYICDSCVAQAGRTVTGSSRAQSWALAREGVWSRCSFCGKRRTRQLALVMGPGSNICGRCLRTCREILNDRLNSFDELPRIAPPGGRSAK